MPTEMELIEVSQHVKMRSQCLTPPPRGGVGRVGGATWLCHSGPFPVSRLPNGGVLGGGSGSQTGEWWWSEGGGVAVSGTV